jgi:hypothetical protein
MPFEQELPSKKNVRVHLSSFNDYERLRFRMTVTTF